MRWVAVALALLLVSGNCVARSEVRPLEGTYYFRGATAVDPAPDEPKDTHLLIELTGNAARDLYRGMKVAAKRDQCVGAGAMSKTVGGMQCTMLSSTRYRCHFAIEIARQRITHGLAC